MESSTATSLLIPVEIMHNLPISDEFSFYAIKSKFFAPFLI